MRMRVYRCLVLGPCWGNRRKGVTCTQLLNEAATVNLPQLWTNMVTQGLVHGTCCKLCGMLLLCCLHSQQGVECHGAVMRVCCCLWWPNGRCMYHLRGRHGGALQTNAAMGVPADWWLP